MWLCIVIGVYRINPSNGNEIDETDALHRDLYTAYDEYATKFDKEQLWAEKYKYYLEQSQNHQFLANVNQRRRLLDISVPVVTIPIVFHLLYSNQQQNISDDQIYSQLKGIVNTHIYYVYYVFTQ